MNRDEVGLLAWQWSDYPSRHRNRANLIVHVLSVPFFIAAFFSLIVALVHLAWVPALVCIAVMGAVIALQGRGHRLESTTPAPFRGPADVVARLFVEQLVTFPRFVWSGELARALRASD
ncbi:MAG: Mpo1-like protein [Polyangiaceae bacterium]